MTKLELAGHLWVEIGANGVAELILGPEGGMPATDAKAHAALGSIWAQLEAMPEVRCILVRSLGRAFCAGGTLELVGDMLQDERTRLRVMREARAMVRGMLECELPIVSAINGAAVGAGAALALLADISIAGSRARIIDGHTRLGVAAGDHAALIWPLLCGMAKAKYYLLLCDSIDGREAERIGLVSQVVDDLVLLSTARDVAARLAAGSPGAIAQTKHSLNHWLRAAWPAFEHSLNAEMLGFSGADAVEGLAAIKEKREPAFGPR
ncbi:MAG: enoyl-CoA hydratase/isomerase family protein [Thiothrix sp.]|nr:enoyl-CoA hydratase/isomerase family protein [Thiothrix sp.]HPQ95431.1 enoyl-CoA hydratase/isomerase family protein [Thiolinea sp.]